MSLLVILATGVLLGWLVNLLAPAGRRGDGLADVALGAAGAFVCGGLAGSQSLAEGVTLSVLVAAALGALVLSATVHVLRFRSRRPQAAEGRANGGGRDGDGPGWTE